MRSKTSDERSAGRIEKPGEETGFFRSISLFFDALFSGCPRFRLRKTAPHANRTGQLPFLNVGHRGSPVAEVENTIPSFARALEQGANALELDLCITADGHPVIWHDHDPSDFVVRLRNAGLEPDVAYTTLFPDNGPYRRPIHELTLAEFREHCGYRLKRGDDPVDVAIPTFAEFIDWLVEGEHRIDALFLDVKIPPNRAVDIEPFMESVGNDIARLPGGIAIVFETTSGDLQDLMKRETDRHIDRPVIHALDTEVNPGLILLPRLYSAIAHALRRSNGMAIPLRPRPITIAPWVTYRRLIAGDITRMRRYNRRNPEAPVAGLIGATINDPAEIECLIALGITGMQTDRPDLVAEALERVESGSS